MALKGHVCTDRCVCPIHQTQLLYSPAMDTHACQERKCPVDVAEADFGIVQTWAHWEKDGDGFVVADRGTPGSWDRGKLRVHLHGGIEFNHPEGASPFLSGPDECRFLAMRLMEASLISELCKQGWMIE